LRQHACERGSATLAGALAIGAEAAPGAKVLCMLPDTGERYSH
jgi:cysteine synthase A